MLEVSAVCLRASYYTTWPTHTHTRAGKLQRRRAFCFLLFNSAAIRRFSSVIDAACHFCFLKVITSKKPNMSRIMWQRNGVNYGSETKKKKMIHGL